MSNKLKILAIIPARAGSKRLAGKNTREICGKPLISWSIEFAKGQPEITNILVSTDSYEIALIAKNCGAHVPWLRPANLASDYASTVDVITHALAKESAAGRDYDFFVLLQPTSPIRSSEIFKQALGRSIAMNGSSVISVGLAKSNPLWCFSLKGDDQLRPYLDEKSHVTRSQDLPSLYEATGNIYIMGVQKFLKTNNLFGESLYAVISPDRRYDVDIDDEIDWIFAESLIAKYGLGFD